MHFASFGKFKIFVNGRNSMQCYAFISEKEHKTNLQVMYFMEII